MSINSLDNEAAFASPQKQAMDRMYRFQRHIYDATRTHYLLGRDEMIASLRPPPGGTILEIGCGTGRNLVMAANKYPDARVFGIDISDEMLTSACAAIERNGMSKRVFVMQGDATETPRALFDTDGFDRIFFSYTLSMIPDWKKALHNSAGLVSPDGSMHIVDFGPCEGLPAAFRQLLHFWLRRFGVVPRSDMAAVLEIIAAGRKQLLVSHTSHRGYALHHALEKSAQT